MIVIKYKVSSDTAEHTACYSLAHNAVSALWERKIKHLQRIPFSTHYTGLHHQRKLNTAQLLQEIQQAWNDLNQQGILQRYQGMDQGISNQLHSWLVHHQYQRQYSHQQRELMHQLHRLIHAWEQVDRSPHTFPVGWGEREGPLQQPMDPAHLGLYQYPLTTGDLYLVWSEFGKRPYDLFVDGLGPEAVAECRAHETLRAKFDVALSGDHAQFEPGWRGWWQEFKTVWRPSCVIEWSPLYQWGGIPVAHRISDTSDIVQVDTVLSVAVTTD
jgi:hypothetical protein